MQHFNSCSAASRPKHKATQDLFGKKTQVAQQPQNLILFFTYETEEKESYTMEKLFLLGLCNFTKKYVTIGWQL